MGPAAAVRAARPAAVAPAGPAGTGGDLVADILVIAIAANCAAFVLEVPMADIYVSHEIAPVASLGAALAGRVLGGRIIAGWPSWPGARRVLLPAFAVVVACYAAMLGIAAAYRQAPPRNVGITAWLTRHHLTSGFAPYWEAASITVDSGGKITLLSVTEPAITGTWRRRSG